MALGITSRAANFVGCLLGLGPRRGQKTICRGWIECRIRHFAVRLGGQYLI